MALANLLKEVDRLSQEELQQLQEHIARRRRMARLKAFDEAIAALREGLTEEQIDEIEQAMNAEYIEPVDLDEWRD